MAGSRIDIRPATADDRDRLLAWANDPVTRVAGFHTDPIAAEEHAAWFGRVLADASRRRIWIGHEGSREVGLVRVDLTPDGRLAVGIALDASARGSGRSRALLDAGLAAARATFPGHRFRAWIKPTNAPSLALFHAAGFEPPLARPPGPAGAPPDVIVLERD